MKGKTAECGAQAIRDHFYSINTSANAAKAAGATTLDHVTEVHPIMFAGKEQGGAMMDHNPTE